MQDRKSLRIGCVEYLNARPLIHGWASHVEFGPPSALCARLAAGALDIALVSSFEFLRNPTYRIVDGISISSDGPVYSVIVAHQDEISKVDQVELDPASETSVALLRYLLTQWGLDPELIPRSTSPRAQLLIGDQAIRLRQSQTNLEFWDLGAAWKQVVGLPFVYALWLVRPEVSDAESIAHDLRALRDRNISKISDVVTGESEFDREFCYRYYTENIRFGLGDREKMGLQRFATECSNLGLIPTREFALNLV